VVRTHLLSKQQSKSSFSHPNESPGAVRRDRKILAVGSESAESGSEEALLAANYFWGLPVSGDGNDG
jgi:hypothetical protein